MKDTIYREDAIEAIKGNSYADDDYIEINGYGAIKDISALPSADRPQGTWFKDDEGTFICSACGSGYKDQPTIMGKPMFEWCPICGCRMKGADDEDN